MLMRRIARTFSGYMRPQKFDEFVKPQAKIDKEKVSLDSHNKKALTFRKVDLQDFDFETEESDFDTERFSFKEYLYTCIYYTERSMTVLIGFMSVWTLFTFISKFLMWFSANLRLKLGPVGYFGMVEPAFQDIELERKKQRISLDILHSYD